MQKKPDNTEALVQTGAITDTLLSDIRALIEQARERMAQTVNAELVILNWHIGKRIQKDVLAQERAEYGKQIVATVSRQLTCRVWKRVHPRCTFPVAPACRAVSRPQDCHSTVPLFELESFCLY